MEVRRRIRESMIADNITTIARKDLTLAKDIANSLKDREAKVLALLNLYSFSGDSEFLILAKEFAESDDDLLRIVEVADEKFAKDVAYSIKDDYKKNLAFAHLLERFGNLNYAMEINDQRILSASLKRLVARIPHPRNLILARMIPDPYYKCLALLEISKKENLDKNEILVECSKIKNKQLRNWLFRKIQQKLLPKMRDHKL